MRLGTTGIQTGALAAGAIPFPVVAVLGGWTVGARAPLARTLLFAIGVTWAVVAVTATGLVTRLAPAADRAEALGFYTAVAGVGTGLDSVAGGALATRAGNGLTFWIAGAVVLLGTGLVITGESDGLDRDERANDTKNRVHRTAKIFLSRVLLWPTQSN